MPAHTGSSPLTASSGRSGPETGSQTTEYALTMVVTMKIDHRGLGRRRLSAESSARSWGWSRGRECWRRWRTAATRPDDGILWSRW
jgi:hypothetical protein